MARGIRSLLLIRDHVWPGLALLSQERLAPSIHSRPSLVPRQGRGTPELLSIQKAGYVKFRKINPALAMPVARVPFVLH